MMTNTPTIASLVNTENLFDSIVMSSINSFTANSVKNIEKLQISVIFIANNPNYSIHEQCEVLPKLSKPYGLDIPWHYHNTLLCVFI